MKKFVLVPDSFKGTMTSAQVCASMEAGIRRVLPQAVRRDGPWRAFMPCCPTTARR